MDEWGVPSMLVELFSVCSILDWEWTGRDLDPRPPDCESGVHTTELPALQHCFSVNYRPL